MRGHAPDVTCTLRGSLLSPSRHRVLSLANVTFCFAMPEARLTSMYGAPPWRIEKIDA